MAVYNIKNIDGYVDNNTSTIRKNIKLTHKVKEQ